MIQSWLPRNAKYIGKVCRKWPDKSRSFVPGAATGGNKWGHRPRRGFGVEYRGCM